MSNLTFSVLMLLNSVVLCFVILSTFYGSVKAYLAISWVPITLFLIISMFLQIDYSNDSRSVGLGFLLEAVAWTSFLQGLLGTVLVIRALIKKKEWVIPAIASLITALPFFLVR